MASLLGRGFPPTTNSESIRAFEELSIAASILEEFNALSTSEPLHGDIFEAPLALALAEKERKVAHMAMSESFQKERVSALVSKQIKENDTAKVPGSILVRVIGDVSPSTVISIAVNSNCLDVLNTMAEYFKVDVSKVVIFSHDIDIRSHTVNIDNCEEADEFIKNKFKCSVYEYFNKQGSFSIRTN